MAPTLLVVPQPRLCLRRAWQLRPPRASTAARASATSPSQLRRSQNVDGEFFVDRRCIDCDACRWLAPETFRRVDGQSAVFKQPSSDEEKMKALQALICCPTNSIHTKEPRSEVQDAKKSFPLLIDEQTLPGVYHCGFHSENTYGATSYLITHPEGNVLVDCPRYVVQLARDIQKLGGARYMFLTHKDDVGDHELWCRQLGCERILHSEDVEASTAGIEKQLFGNGPWSIGKDFELIHTPGHTLGSVCLYYKPLKILFTGDHIAMTEESELKIFEQYNRVSVEMQLNNIRMFLDMDISWFLPGHGRRVHFKDAEEKNTMLQTFLARKIQNM